MTTPYVETLEDRAAWQGEVLAELAATMQVIGCECGEMSPASTPPMMYREWLLCCRNKAFRAGRAFAGLDLWLGVQP